MRSCLVLCAALVGCASFTASSVGDGQGDAAADAGEGGTGTDGGDACPCTLFGSMMPSQASFPEADALELGLRFTSDRPATVTGARFYKGPENTGVHTGSLWSAAGSRLAVGTFVDETAEGWQTLTFESAVPIEANTEYVVSYHTNVGYYAFSEHFFDSGFARPPLRAAMAAGVFGTAADTMPDTEYDASNYWVDVVVR